MHCATCGTPMPAGAAFCTRCGGTPARPQGYPQQAQASPVQGYAGAAAQPQQAQYPPAHHPVPATPGTAPCPRCRTVIPLTSQTCPACALPLAQPQLAPRPNTVPCPRCKAQVVVGSRSCQSCGFTPGLPPSQQPGAPAAGIVAGFWNQVDSYASLDKLEGFSLKEMFSEVFRKRQQDEIDDYFQVGSKATTPDITEVQTGWPKPWFFGRVLMFVSALYFGQYIAFEQFQNTLMLPGMMMTGALAMPFATAILFFELNTPRNVAFHRVLSLVCMGGVLSIFISLIGFQVSQLHAVLGAPAAGIIEEIGKLLTVILMARKIDKPYILNGCLFGAAVGAGFAAFESAGYAFNAFLGMLPDKSHAGILFAAGGMVKSITLRGVLAPFGHVAWTGITAGLLWRARAQTPSFDKAVFEKRFIRGFILVMTMHALWNFTAGFGLIVALPFMALIGAVSWYIVFGIVQQGLRQVRGAQKMTHTAMIRAFGPSAAQS